uniref:Uncharacterized protein n=1 Tax=Zea mays TaxID=4577 RepID=B4FPW9_MAIZE|nr:unknown [Zea mays]|eukprot:NP_001140606.1 uncharacterized protein LOC100272677 [Zea mays]
MQYCNSGWKQNKIVVPCRYCNISNQIKVNFYSAMEQKIHVNPLKILSQTKCTHIQNSSSSCPNQLRRIRMPWILRGRSPPIARSLCKLMQMRQLPRLRLLASSGGHYTPH